MNKTLLLLTVILTTISLHAANVIKRPLNGGWQFRQEKLGSWKRDSPKDTVTWRPAKVPGTIHTDLYSGGIIGDPFWRMNEREQQWIDKVNWEYRTSFDAGDIVEKDSICLVFNGLDSRAVITLNGKKILYADNAHRRWKADVKDIIKEKDNELHILFISPVIEGLREATAFGTPIISNNDQSMLGGVGTTKVSSFTRKAGYHFGWDLTGRFVTSGIWRPIELVAWNTARIDNIYVYTKKAGKKTADMGIDLSISSMGRDNYTIDLLLDGKTVRSFKRAVEGMETLKEDFVIPDPRLWYPNGDGPANLYDLTVRLKKEGKLLDEHNIRTGIRTMHLIQEEDRDKNGSSFIFEINGKRTFAKGSNWVASDMFMPNVTPEHLEHLVKSCADANMNMLRVWGGANYEDNLFYELCDKYGILVWQDFMFSVAVYPVNDHFIQNVRAEADNNIKRLRNHPSIVLWCGNNEIESMLQPFDTKPRATWRWKTNMSQSQREMWDRAYDTIFHKVLPAAVEANTYENIYWRSSPSSLFGVGFNGPIDKEPDPKFMLRYGDVHQWDVCHRQARQSYYDENVGRFMSEYGMISYNEISSMENYLDKNDLVFKGEALKFHSRFRVAETVALYLNWYYRMPTKFEDIVYMSQIMQADVIAHGIQAHRRNMPWCMGSLYWQINDSWPGDTWSSIDYYGKWKALHYATRDNFEPVAVLPYLDGDNSEIFLVSDKTESLTGKMELTLIDFDGKKLKSEKFNVEMPANTSKNIKTLNVASFIGDADRDRVVLACKFTAGDIQHTTLQYLDSIKLLKLPKVNIKLETLPGTEKGTVTVRVTTDKLAKNIAVYYEGVAGFFSDNYFDMLPGETRYITIKTDDSPETVLKNLSYNTMNDVYGRL